jgi:hypothetical protein
MKWGSILPLVVVLTTSSALAQWNLPGSLDLNPGSCPVGLHVKHADNSTVRNVGDDHSRPTGPAQRIQLTMTNPQSRGIVSGQFTVHGFSNKWRAIPLSEAAAAPDLAKTIDIALDVKGNGQTSRDLSLSRFAAVTAIDVNWIKYADGSEWHTPSPGACTVAPDPLMLVAAR